MSSTLWKVIQESTLQTLKKNRNNIQNVSFDIRKGKVAGSSTSIVGGIITIIGFLLLLNDDFILSSIVLTVIGSLIAIYGGLISIVATIVKCVLQKRERKEAKEIATIYVQLCRIILDLVEELEVAHKDEDQTQDRYQTFARAIRTTLQSGMILTYGGLFITRTGGTAALRGWILTFRIVSIGVRIVAIAGAITAVFMIVIDVWELLFNAYKLRIKKEPELVKRMNTFIDEIEKQKEQYHQNIENERTVIQLQTPAPVEDAAV